MLQYNSNAPSMTQIKNILMHSFQNYVYKRVYFVKIAFIWLFDALKKRGQSTSIYEL